MMSADPASVEVAIINDGPGGPPESLVLDIGGEIGALILYASAEALGSEIDITPVGMPQSHGTHTVIRRRRSLDREIVAAVYPELPEGVYTVWGLDGRSLGKVPVVGGRISFFDAGDCRGNDRARS